MLKVMYVETQEGCGPTEKDIQSLEAFMASAMPNVRMIFLPPGCKVTDGRPRGYTYRTEIGHTAEEVTFTTRQEMLDYIREIRTKP